MGALERNESALAAGRADEEVTLDNVGEYLELRATKRLGSNLRPWIAALRAGLHRDFEHREGRKVRTAVQQVT